MTATYLALATITLTSTDSEIVFSSIPATYRDLIVVAQIKASATVENTNMRMNADTGANYSYVNMRGNGSVPASNAEAGQTYIRMDLFPSGVSTSGNASYVIQIFDYAQTNKHKTVMSRYNDAAQAVGALSGRYASTNAVNSVTLYIDSTSFAIGSTFSLYGIN